MAATALPFLARLGLHAGILGSLSSLALGIGTGLADANRVGFYADTTTPGSEILGTVVGGVQGMVQKVVGGTPCLGIGTTSPRAPLDVRGTGFSARIGTGVALGAPVGVVTFTTGSGSLTGVYQYAYTETDSSGQTTLSPAQSVTLSSNNVTVTVPLMRRGASGRNLYRTLAGGSTFYLVHTFADGHFSKWVDNTPDGSLVTPAPVSDTSLCFNLDVTDTVKYFRTHPNQGTGAADLTMLTGDPATGGAWAIDAYQCLTAKVANGQSFYSKVFGTSAAMFLGQYVSATDDGSSPTTAFQIFWNGCTTISPGSLLDQGHNALDITAVMPPTSTGSNVGLVCSITGNGSSAFNQFAATISLNAGYTGASTCAALDLANRSASSGCSISLRTQSSGASTLNVGVQGRANGATNNIGVYASVNNQPDALTESAALVVDTGSGVTPYMILGHTNDGSVKYRVTNGGALGVKTTYDPANALDVQGGVAIGFSSQQTAPTNGLNVNGNAYFGGGGSSPDSNIQAKGLGVGGRGGGVRSTNAFNSYHWGHSNTGYLSTLGAFSTNGPPFIAFYAYHSTTANTLAYASGTNVPAYIGVSTSGVLTYNTAAAGTVDTDISGWTARLTVGPSSAAFAAGTPLTINDTTASTSATTGCLIILGGMGIGDGKNIGLGTTTGTIIGTSNSQKLGLWGVSPVVQPNGTGNTTTSAAGSTTNVFTNTTFTGGIGSTAYTVGDVVKALKQLGAMAA